MIVSLAIVGFLLLPIQETAQEPTGQGQGPGAAEPSAHTKTGTTVPRPKKTKDVRPKWPQNALRAGLHGAVVLECVIGTDGKVSDIKHLSGYRSLTDAAREAVQQWTYSATVLNGVRVPVIMTVTANFNMSGPPDRDDALKSMTDPDPEIRWAAVQWLATYRPATAKQRKAIESAVQDPSPLVQNAAKVSLKKLDEGPR